MSSDSDPGADSDPQSQPQQAPLRARVPDHVGQGHFSTGAIVMTGPNEFIIDFVMTVSRPSRIVQRVVIPHSVLPQFVDALKQNLSMYSDRFGEPPTPPPGDPNARKPSIQEIYDDLKLPDEALS
ncbi:MAG: DUF3467 domain-containing protein, partial [Planctomycetota bacterium]